MARPAFGIFIYSHINHKTMENKYEAKEAWAVRKYSLKVTKGLLISMNGNPMFFREPSTMFLYEPNEVVIFDTKDEANAYSKEKKSEYKALAKQTLSNIDILDHISTNIIQRKDYLPQKYNQRNNDYWYDRHYELRRVMRTGIININAISFRKEDVAHIEWGDDCAKVCLKDGSDVKTYGELEFNLIEDIFGENNSDRTYTELKDEKEKEDEADD